MKFALLTCLLFLGLTGAFAQKAVKNTTAYITSLRCDFDRNEGVVMFDKNVYIDYDGYQMSSDRLFAFISGTNEVTRVVALGSVSVTNGARIGTCEMATYDKRLRRIEMFADSKSRKLAKLNDTRPDGGTIEGSKITFWTESEEVEIENSRIEVKSGKSVGKGVL